MARGQELHVAAEITAAVLTRFRERLDELENASDDDANERKALTYFQEWHQFEERFKFTLNRLRSSVGARPTLIYVILPNSEVGEDALADVYTCIDDDLNETHTHEGESFERDNSRVYNNLQELCIGTPAWSFVREHRSTRNGRAAFLTLKTQSEGRGSPSRKEEQMLHYSSYSTLSREGRFSYDSYVEKHLTAHQELDELDEPVPRDQEGR